MLYMFIKMSSKWFCREIETIESVARNVMLHVESGELVTFADDVEGFADEMEIEVTDIEMIKGN